MQIHIPLAIICILLCLLPFSEKFRRNWILPICIILITIYMAIRYDYGLDYWSYYTGFINEERRSEFNEPLFWLFCSIFPKYYQVIAAISCFLMAIIYFIVKNCVPERYYALFFLFFFCIPGMSFTMMTALRSVMAFVVLSYGIYKYYIKKFNIGLYLLSVIIASLFHNSALFFIILPVLCRFVLKLDPSIVFISFIVFSFFSFTGITQDIGFIIFKNLNGLRSEEYDLSVYATKYVSNINGAIGRSPFLFPAYFICKYKKIIKDNEYSKFYALSVVYLWIFFLTLDVEFRFTMYMLIYFIIAMAICLTRMKLMMKLILILPVLVSCVYQLNSYFNLMREEMFGDYVDGNFYIYETIFQHLPLF